MPKYKYSYADNPSYEISMETNSIDSYDFVIDFGFLIQEDKSESNCQNILLTSTESIDERLEDLQNIPNYELLEKYIIGVAFGVNYGYEVYRTENSNAKKLKFEISSLTMGIGFPVDIIVYATICSFWKNIDFVPLEMISYGSDCKSLLKLPHSVQNRFVVRDEVNPIRFYNPMSQKNEFGSNSKYSWNVKPNFAPQING